MRVLRFGSSLGWAVVAAAFAGHAFAQGAPAEPGRGAPPPRPAPAPVFRTPAPAAKPPTPPASPAPAPAPAPAPTPAPAASAPAVPAPVAAPGAFVAVNAPDIIRLKNGGLLRGTISELVPGDYVTLVLITGETRKVAYADVQYAGAASAETGVPAAAPAGVVAAAPAAVGPMPSSNKSTENQPFAVVHAAESVVSVVSKQDGLTLFRRAASAEASGSSISVTGYSEVCTTPCSVSMPSGTHTFAVARAGSKPHEAEAVTLPAGKATMTIAVVDRSAIRVGVGVLGAVGLIAGLALAASDSGDGSIAGPIVLSGLGAGAVGLAFAISNGATVAVRADAPASSSAANRSSAWLDARSRDSSSRLRPPGLTLSVHF